MFILYVRFCSFNEENKVNPPRVGWSIEVESPPDESIVE